MMPDSRPVQDLQPSPPGGGKTRILLFTLGVFGINLLLRLWAVGRNDLAMDEPFALWWAQQDLSAILGMLSGGNDSLLHYLVLHGWIKIFGDGAWAVRFPSVLFSSAAASLIFYTAWKFFSPRVALAAAGVFTLSVLQMVFSHEARAYPLFVLLSSWNLWLVLSLLRRPDQRWLYAWLFTCDLLLIHTHYFGWIVVMIQIITLLLSRDRKRIWLPLGIVTLALLLCYIPGARILYERMLASSGGTWVRKPEWSELYGNINRFLNSRWISLTFLITGLAGLSLTLIKGKFRDLLAEARKNRYWKACLLIFILPWAGMFAVSFLIPVFLDRYLLFITPALYLALLAFYEILPLHPMQKTVLMIVPVACMLFFFESAPSNHRPVKMLADALKEGRGKKELLLITPDYSCLEFSYHYDRDIFRDYRHTRERLRKEGIYPVNGLGDFRGVIPDSIEAVLYLDCGTAFAMGSDLTGRDLEVYFGKGKRIYKDEVYVITKYSRP